jgi:hypothetical protein
MQSFITISWRAQAVHLDAGPVVPLSMTPCSLAVLEHDTIGVRESSSA